MKFMVISNNEKQKDKENFYQAQFKFQQKRVSDKINQIQRILDNCKLEEKEKMYLRKMVIEKFLTF